MRFAKLTRVGLALFVLRSNAQSLTGGWVSFPQPAITGFAADTLAVHDTLRLYYVGYAVGHERYDLTRDAIGFRLSADFDYVDRGRPTHVVGTYRLAPDYTPELLEITRLSDTSSTLESRVEVHGRNAIVVAERRRRSHSSSTGARTSGMRLASLPAGEPSRLAAPVNCTFVWMQLQGGTT